MTKNSSINSSVNEFGVSSKKFQEGQVVVVELGLKLEQDQDRSFLFDQSRRAVADHHDDDGDASCGPTCNGYNMINNTPIYSFATPIVGDFSSSVVPSSTTTTTTSIPDSAGVVRGLQPFDVSSFYSSANPFSKSPGGMATTGIGFQFTASQWKELERQAMIYKYMMASLPVPPDLLYSSIPTNFSTSSTFAPTSYFLEKYGSGISMRWSGNSKDAEPGRCRRTDGKKWRCSRDVAPNQKYCERHMHRGRPRSRKHVELQQQLQLQQQQQQQQNQHHSSSVTNLSFNNNNNNSSNSNSNNKDTNTPPKKSRLSDSLLSSNNSHCVGSSVQPSSKVSIFDHSLGSAAASFFDDSRNLGWTEDQQWSQLVQTNMNSSVFQHQLEGGPLKLNSHAEYNPKSDDMDLLERPLIDTWSMGAARDKNSVGNVNKLSLSSSNGGNVNAIDEEMCQIHMGLGLIDSWVGSTSTTTTPGGPLAEALRSGNPAISDGGESELLTPPATAVSSPSGVLQKTIATYSDSSGSTSPTTCHHSKSNSDMPFHWLN